MVFIHLSELGEVVQIEAFAGEHEEILKKIFKPGSKFGKHSHCWGTVRIHEISSTHNVFLCRDCGMRIPFPKKFKTVEEIRDHFEPPGKSEREEKAGR